MLKRHSPYAHSVSPIPILTYTAEAGNPPLHSTLPILRPILTHPFRIILVSPNCKAGLKVVAPVATTLLDTLLLG